MMLLGSFHSHHQSLSHNFYPPIPTTISSDRAIRVEDVEPLPGLLGSKWITNFVPILNEQQFLLASASAKNPGLFCYTAKRNAFQKIPGIEDRIWDLSVSSNRSLLVIRDENILSAGRLEIQEGLWSLDSYCDLVRDTASVMEQVAFAPHSGETYALRLKSGFEVRSVDSLTPLHTVSFDEMETTSLEWSQHDPYIYSCILNGNGFRLYDLRIKGKPIYSRKTRANITSKLRWNPFLPYCLGTSEDGNISIFDLRYQSREPQCRIPIANVNDFSWSNSNCELMMASCSDRTVSLWSLLEPTHPQFMTFHKEVGGDIVKLMPSERELNTFHGLGALGKLIKIGLNEKHLQTLAPSSNENSLEKEIEKSLYIRDMRTVYKKLLESSNSTTECNSFKLLQSLTARTSPLPAIDEFVMGKLARTSAEFQSDISHFSRCCPPGFDAARFNLNDVSTRFKEAMEKIRFKVKILESVNESKIMTFELTEIIKCLESSRNFFGEVCILKILSIVLGEDREAGLVFARDLIERVFDEMSGSTLRILHAALYPTIFDNLTIVENDFQESKQKSDALVLPRPTAQSNSHNISHDGEDSTIACISETVSSIDELIAMIDLELLMERTVDEKEKMGILENVFANHTFTTISFKLISTHLEGLADRSQLDLYLVYLSAILQKAPQTLEILLAHLEREVLPKIKYVLAQAIDTQRPTLVMRAIMLILTMSHLPLRSSYEALLIDRLRRLNRIMVGEEYQKMSQYPQLITLLETTMKTPTNSGIYLEITRLHSRLCLP